MEEESMSDPGFAPPDLCSIRTAAERKELAEAVRGGFSATATHWAAMTTLHP
jgi:hypothetical protein